MSEQVRRETEDALSWAAGMAAIQGPDFTGNSIIINVSEEDMVRFEGLAQMAEDAGIHIDSQVLAELLLEAMERRIGTPIPQEGGQS